MTESYPLIVAQYTLEDHPRRTEHWSLVVLKSADFGYIYELSGNSSNYKFNKKVATRFRQSQKLRGGALVGYIREDQVGSMENLLRGVSIVFYDPNFDCQTWVLQALWALRNNGADVRITNEQTIRQELAREKARWEGSEDTLEDRLFARR